jgi:CubicO group peptidase (beta-lactamase class C family)
MPKYLLTCHPPEKLRRVASVAVAMSLAFVAPSFARDASAPAPSPQGLANLTSFLDTEVSTGKLPGAVVLIQQHGKPAYLRCFGVRDVATRVPMSTDTIFALRSMTKPITSVAAFMLVDAGKLSLDDPVSKYIPSFGSIKVGIETTDAQGRPAFDLVAPDRPVTIADLMRHTAGISYGYIGGASTRRAYAEANLFDGRFDNAEFAERIAKLPLAKQPGTLWRYGHSTDVLGRVIEVISGQSLYHFMRDNIFTPLGMTSTKFVLETDAERARMAEPLPDDKVLVDSERERRARPFWESGGGGLVSTVTDYARFAQMLLNGGELDGKRIISPAAYKLLTTDQIGPGSGVARDFFYYPGDGFGFGFGLAVRTDPGNAKPPAPGSIGELKWDGGSGTYFGVDPKLDMVYFLMQQTERERGRVTRAFKALVYSAFTGDAPTAAGMQLAGAAGAVAAGQAQSNTCGAAAAK